MSFQQVENLVVMSTSLVATVIIMHRRGISKDHLLNRVIFLYNEVLARGGIVQINIIPTEKIVSQCLLYLSEFIDIKNSIV